MIRLRQPMEFYATFLEWYVAQTSVKRYLEIGCAKGGLIWRLMPKLERAVGVDIVEPNKNDGDPAVFWFTGPSDEFFRVNQETFDLIFIDGDHEAEQVFTDTINALKCLAPNGLILLHDTYPPHKDFTREEFCGNAWEAAKRLKLNSKLDVFTFPVTYGLTLVRRLEPEPWL